MPIALHTDRYELTMLDAALGNGTADRHCVFEVFTRRLPSWRRYGVFAGTGRLLEILNSVRFSKSELEFLIREGVIIEATAEYLANYRFTGSMHGYAEGETYFPESPLLTVEGTFAEAVILETLILSILNYDSAVAAAASRMTAASQGRPCLEMGSRRANEYAAVSAARAAAVAGFAGTSNLEAGYRWSIPTIGTAAHAFTLLHDDEESAFAAQVESLGVSTTLLVDTYDVHQGVETAVRVAGTELGAVRIDSGDLATLAVSVRAQLDSLGATNTKIVVTSDLDEYAIASLRAAPVDVYGVGTQLVTGAGAPTCGMVYKLVAREGRDGHLKPVAKLSTQKKSTGGRKLGFRQVDATGRASAELVICGVDGDISTPQGLSGLPDFAETPDFFGLGDGTARALSVPLVTAGSVLPGHTGVEGLANARARHTASLAELPAQARRLSRGEPAIPTQVYQVN